MTQAQQLADLSQAYTAGALGWRNRIVGGCCRIAQRPSIAVTQANGGGIYGGPDHFQCYNLGSAANGQFTQSASTINFNNVLRPAVQQNVDTPIVNVAGAGSNLWGGFVNRLEGFDCFDLMGRAMTLSFVYFSNVPGVHSVAVLTANYSFVSTFVATGAPQYVAIPLPALPTDAGIPLSTATGISVIIDRLNTGANSTSTLNVWQAGTFVNATNQVNWGATGGNWNLLAELQLEVGTIATPFERRPFIIEYAMLRRYYQTILAFARFNSTVAAIMVDTPLYWDPMRVTPAVTIGTDGSAVNITAASTLANAYNARCGRFEIVSAGVGDCYVLGRTIMLNAEL